MRWRFILSKYPIITFNNLFYSRKQFLTQISTIIFFINRVTIVTYKKKGLITLYHEIAADTMTFLDVLFVELKKFSSGISDFFPLPHTRSFYRSAGTARVKSFSSCQTVFSFIRMLLSNLSLRGTSAGSCSVFESLHSFVVFSSA